jgi:hypothetical protein
MFGFGFHQSKTSVDKTTINKSISSTLVKNESKQSAAANSLQTMSISNVKMTHCKALITQDAKVSIDILQQISTENQAQLISDLKQKVSDHMETVMKPKSQMFSPAQVSVTVSKLKDRVENVIESTLSVENINSQIANANSLQEQDIRSLEIDACPGYEELMKYAVDTKDPNVIKEVRLACDTSQTCEISQSVRLNIVAQQLANNTVKALIEDTKIQELDTEIKNIIQPEAGGLAQFAQSISPALGVGSCSLCLCCLILAVALYFIWNSDTTKQAVVVAGNVAKSMPPPIP